MKRLTLIVIFACDFYWHQPDRLLRDSHRMARWPRRMNGSAFARTCETTSRLVEPPPGRCR